MDQSRPESLVGRGRQAVYNGQAGEGVDKTTGAIKRWDRIRAPHALRWDLGELSADPAD